MDTLDLFFGDAYSEEETSKKSECFHCRKALGESYDTYEGLNFHYKCLFIYKTKEQARKVKEQREELERQRDYAFRDSFDEYCG